MSAKGKSGFNFYNALFAQQGISTNNVSPDDRVALVQKLRKQYSVEKISNPILIKIVERVDGRERDAIDMINYYVYSPNDAEIAEIVGYAADTNTQIGQEDIKNLIKYHKNINSVKAAILSKKESMQPFKSPYRGLQKELFGTTSDVNETTLRKYFPSRTENTNLGESIRFHVGIANSGNTCFINTSLQLLYHIPNFKELVTNFNLSNPEFVREFTLSKLEPVKALKNTFLKLDNAALLGKRSINISIDLNADFECLWVGSYNETNDEFRKRLEISLGMYKKTDYRPGENESDRRRRIIKEKVSAGQDFATLVKKFAKLEKEVNNIYNKMDERDLLGTPIANSKLGFRKQHDIAEFIEQCIMSRLDKPSARALREPVLFQYQLIKDLYYKDKPSIEGTTIGGYKKISRPSDVLPDTTLKLTLEGEYDRTQSFYLQNLINRNNAKLFDTFSYRNSYRVIDSKIKEARLVIDKAKYVFPEALTHVFIQIKRTDFNHATLTSFKRENAVSVNKIIKIDDTFFECVGAGCQFGGANGGHYAYVHKESDGKWIEFNDGTIKSHDEVDRNSTFVEIIGLNASSTVSLSKSAYCFLYKKLTDYTDEQYRNYITAMNAEVSGIPNLKIIPEIDGNPSAEKIVDYEVMYKKLKQTLLEGVARNIEGSKSPEEVKKGADFRYYMKLLRDTYPGAAANTNEGVRRMRDRIMSKFAETSEMDDLEILKTAGIVTPEEAATIEAGITQIKESKAREETAKKAEEAAKEETLVSTTRTTYEQKNIEERMKAAADAFSTADSGKKELGKDGIQILKGEIIGSEKTAEDIIKEYKATVVIQVLAALRLHKKFLFTKGKRSGEIITNITTAENIILQHLRNIDKETGSTFIYQILQLKDTAGAELFTLQELIQRTVAAQGILANTYSAEEFSKNRNRATRVAGGGRKKKGTQKKKRTTK